MALEPTVVQRPVGIGPAAWEESWRYYVTLDREGRHIVTTWVDIATVLCVSRRRAKRASITGDPIAGYLRIYRSSKATKGPDSAAWAYVSDLCEWDDARRGKRKPLEKHDNRDTTDQIGRTA